MSLVERGSIVPCPLKGAARERVDETLSTSKVYDVLVSWIGEHRLQVEADSWTSAQELAKSRMADSLRWDGHYRKDTLIAEDTNQINTFEVTLVDSTGALVTIIRDTEDYVEAKKLYNLYCDLVTTVNCKWYGRGVELLGDGRRMRHQEAYAQVPFKPVVEEEEDEPIAWDEDDELDLSGEQVEAETKGGGGAPVARSLVADVW